MLQSKKKKRKGKLATLETRFFFLSLCAVHQEKAGGVRVKRVLIIDRTWELRKLWEKRSKVEWDSALLFCFCGRHRENSARRKASVSSLNQGAFPSLLFFLPLSSLFFSFSLSSVSSTMVHLAPSIQWLRSLRFHKERFFFFCNRVLRALRTCCCAGFGFPSLPIQEHRAYLINSSTRLLFSILASQIQLFFFSVLAADPYTKTNNTHTHTQKKGLHSLSVTSA